MEEVIHIKPFNEIDIEDPFFDSLSEDYEGFKDWFERKSEAGTEAYVQYIDGALKAFLYLKDESDTPLEDVTPPRPACRRLKVGTFKVDPHNTRLGERFVKKIMDKGIVDNYDEIYLTIFPKHEGLINLLMRYGFKKEGTKGGEIVMVKDLKNLSGDILLDYPLVDITNSRKFLLAIKPEYHTKMFPDSILRNEDLYDLIKDVSYTNGIHKIYISSMEGTKVLRRGDIIVIYRTSDGNGPAMYRSVVTSVCQVEEVKTKSDFAGLEEFIDYTNKYSIFDGEVLNNWFKYKPNFSVIKMTYNIALNKRVIRKCLIEELGITAPYWGFFKLTDDQFEAILKKGEVNENLIIR